jgi:hypothetical protein
MEYVYWHYVTNKDNTEFWKNFTKNNKIPNLIKNILNINKERILSRKDFDIGNNIHFNVEDFLCVLFGHKLLDKKMLEKYREEIQNYEEKNNILRYSQDARICISHKKFLEDLKK